jgi:hypothetical protein
LIADLLNERSYAVLTRGNMGFALLPMCRISPRGGGRQFRAVLKRRNVMSSDPVCIQGLWVNPRIPGERLRCDMSFAKRMRLSVDEGICDNAETWPQIPKNEDLGPDPESSLPEACPARPGQIRRLTQVLGVRPRGRLKPEEGTHPCLKQQSRRASGQNRSC